MTPKEIALSRRRFLASTGSAAFFLVRPSRTFGANGISPSSQLNVAFIGMGRRIQGHVRDIIAQQHNVVAFCNVDENQIAKSKTQHGKAVAKTYTDYRRLFDDAASFDAVVISTPDHWHAPICKMAIQANKHVYCEKPLAHTLSEVDNDTINDTILTWRS